MTASQRPTEIFVGRSAIVADAWRFALVGLLATIVDVGVLNLLYYHLHRPSYQAVFFGYLAGTVVAYIINNNWTYRRLQKALGWTAFGQYLIVSLIGLGLTELIVLVVHEHLGVAINIGKLVAVVIVFFWNFFANRLTTFRSGQPAESTSRRSAA